MWQCLLSIDTYSLFTCMHMSPMHHLDLLLGEGRGAVRSIDHHSAPHRRAPEGPRLVGHGRVVEDRFEAKEMIRARTCGHDEAYKG